MAAWSASEETKPKIRSLKSIELTQHHSIDMPISITSNGNSQPPMSLNLTQDGEASGQSGEITDESVGISSEDGSKLYEAVKEGNLEAAKLLVEEDEKLVTCIINDFGETALHIAVYRGHTSIVSYVVTKMKADDFKLKNSSSDTALHLVARSNNVDIATILVDNNKTLLDIKGAEGQLPLHMAAVFGHRDMVMFLYGQSERMKRNHLTAENEDLWTSENRGCVLLACVEAGLFDIAQQIVMDFPELAESTGGPILELLACNLDAFGIKKHDEGNPAVQWLRTVLANFRKPKIDACAVHVDEGNQAVQLLRTVVRWFRTVLANFRKPKIDACDVQVDEGNQAVLLLKTILKYIPKPKLDDILRGPADQIIEVEKREETSQQYPSRVLFVAVEKGNTAFIAVLIGEYPKVLLEVNDKKQNLFQVAVLHRRVGIFNLLNSNKDSIKDSLKNVEDENGNNLLHLVGILEEPMMSNQWQDLKKPHVQMEEEEIWFQMVRDMLPPSLREKKNKAGLRPRELFTKNHKELFLKVVDSEKKTIFGYFSPAVAILLSVVATAGFFRDETGLPLLLTVLLHGMAFVLAFTSVLITWRISDYAVHDFLSLRSIGKLIIELLDMAVALVASNVAIKCFIVDPYRTSIAVVILSFAYSKMRSFLFPRHLKGRTKLA